MRRTRKLSLLSFALAGVMGCAGEDTPKVTVPAAPTLSVSADLKVLEFNWTAGTGVDRYRLLADPSGSGAFAALEENLSATRTSYALPIAVHRIDWSRAQYALEACNAAGCTRSAALSVSNRVYAVIGYLKASETAKRAFFGSTVAVSGDGNTVAVGADGTDSNAGAVFVFAREGDSWTPQGRLAGNFTEAGDAFGAALALTADGNTLIVGAPGEDSGATGVNGNEHGSGRPDSGAAYVFVRSGTAWSQQAYVKASNSDALDGFGTSVAIAADGTTIAAGAPYEDSQAIKVNGNQASEHAPDAGAAYVFVRDGASWAQQAYVKPTNTHSDDWFGHSVALSGNGNTLLVGAPWEDSGATGVGADQTRDDLSKAGAAYIFTRSGTSWSAPLYVKASTTGAKHWFGWTVALSADASTFAVSAPQEDSVASGIGGSQGGNGREDSGAVYVFAQSGSSWQQTAYIKASNPDVADEFGWALALNQSGDTLAVGTWEEDSAATVIAGNGADNTARDAGATYVFKRNAGAWSQQAYVKASNTGVDDHFGYSVALSADGNTLAVGAPGEASAATGIGGNQADDSRAGAGAAYLY